MYVPELTIWNVAVGVSAKTLTPKMFAGIAPAINTRARTRDIILFLFPLPLVFIAVLPPEIIVCYRADHSAVERSVQLQAEHR